MANWVSDFLEQNPEMAARKITRRARKGLHLAGPGKQRTAFLSGAAVQYFDRSRREWLEIDTELQQDASGHYGGVGVPVRVSLDGEARLEGHGYRQRAASVGVFSEGKFQEVTRLGRGKLDGDRVVRERGAYRYESILLPNGLREELILDEYPAGLSGAEGALLAVESLIPGSRVPEGVLEEHQVGDFRFRQGWALDANGERVPVMRWAVTRGGAQQVYSGVPLAWLQEAAYPVVVDPDFSGDNADGEILGSNVSSSSSHSDSSTSISVGGRTYGSAPHVWRGYLKFDTSSIGVGSTVDQVNLRTRVENINTYVSWTVYVRQYNWSSNDPMSGGSRETAWDGLYATGNAATLGTSSNPVGTYVTSGDLSTGWVNKAGYTYYGLWNNKEGYSFPNNEGGQHRYNTSEISTPSYRPLLIIKYTLGNPKPEAVPLLGKFFEPRIAQYDTRVKLRAARRTTSLSTEAGRRDL